MNINLRNYLMELAGSFFLVLTIGMVVIEPQLKYIAPFAIGITLMVMIIVGGHISGGHYNPTVTTAMLFQNAINKVQWLGYIIFQIIGATLAGILAIYFKGTSAQVLEISLGTAFIAEFIYTFLLVYTVLSLSVFPKQITSLLTGIGVGTVVMIGAFTVGSISGGSFNPAVIIGSIILGIYTATDALVVIIAAFSGGITATLFFGTIKSTLPNFQETTYLAEQKKNEEQVIEEEKKEEEKKEEEITEEVTSNKKRPKYRGSIRFADHERSNILRTSKNEK